MRRAEPALKLRHAALLGLLQGPTELLPVSSSAHTSLVPFLAGWRYGELEPGLRKSFELALHGGAGLALLAADGRTMLARARRRDRSSWTRLCLSLAPATTAGLLARGPIERRLGRPAPTAIALLAGGLAMAIADALPRRHERSVEQAGTGDGLALGIAQALALAPGVSRSGATLTAARARGFSRCAAHALSWESGTPVILGASIPELARALVRARAAHDGGLPGEGNGWALAAGAASAFASTAASARLLRTPSLRKAPLAPFAVYRGVLALAAVVRLRRSQ
jgi:undecaprenyl-diphosphatase